MNYFFFVTFVLVCASLRAQDTFSIVAVDTVTAEVGSAGATCLEGDVYNALIISDVIPGVGAIHTQAWWTADNQQTAHDFLLAGYSPQEVIDSVKKYDVDGTPEKRQYGVVDFWNGRPRTAAFTGTETDDYKNHIIGRHYTIQGNILLGQQILDSMEARFLRATGTLADKLMAALQGANVPGADTRCMPQGKSSASAFIRVGKPGNHPDNLYLDLLVPRSDAGRDPIDSLQTLYDAWKAGSSAVERPEADLFDVRLERGELMCVNKTGEQFGEVKVEIVDMLGRILLEKKMILGGALLIPINDIDSQTCFVRIFNNKRVLYSGKFIVQ